MKWIKYPARNRLINLDKIESISIDEDMAERVNKYFTGSPATIDTYTIELYVPDSEEPYVCSYEKESWRDRDFRAICGFVESKHQTFLPLTGNQEENYD